MSVNPLHRARLGSGIALTEVTARTCLSPRIVQLIDAGQFERLPGGLYARSYVRAFASVVGLDPEEVVRELSDRLPPDEDPLPVLRENARGYLPPIVRDLARWTGETRSAVASALSVQAFASAFPGPPVRRLAAAGVDLAVIFLCYAVLIRLTAWVAGLDVQTGVERAGAPVAVVTGVVGLLYFVILRGIGGRTAGAAAAGLPGHPHTSPLSLRDIWSRALSGCRPGGASMPGWDDTHRLDPADSPV